MAKSPDGKTIYPMFEWPLWDVPTKAVESRNGKPNTGIFELDVATRRYSERQWQYQFEEASNAAADFQMLDATTSLVIERDDATEDVGSNEACFALPHLGPEGLTLVDATHIVVANDNNNFPFSSGRTIGQPDDNELTLVDAL